MPQTLTDENRSESDINVYIGVSKPSSLEMPEPSQAQSIDAGDSFGRRPTSIDQSSQTTFTRPPTICPHSSGSNQQVSAANKSPILRCPPSLQTEFGKVPVMPQGDQLDKEFGSNIRTAPSLLIDKKTEDHANILMNDLAAFYAQPISIKAEKGIFVQEPANEDVVPQQNTVPLVEFASSQHVANQSDNDAKFPSHEFLVKMITDNARRLLNKNRVVTQIDMENKDKRDLHHDREECMPKSQSRSKQTFSVIHFDNVPSSIQNDTGGVHREAPALTGTPASVVPRTVCDGESRLKQVKSTSSAKMCVNRVVSTGKPCDKGDKMKGCPSASKCVQKDKATICLGAPKRRGTVTVPCDNSLLVNRTLCTQTYSKKPRECANEIGGCPSTSKGLNQQEKGEIHPSVLNARKTVCDINSLLKNVPQDTMTIPDVGIEWKSLMDDGRNIDVDEVDSSSVTRRDPLLPKLSLESTTLPVRAKHEKAFRCTVCGLSFRSLRSSIAHLNRHTDSEVLSRPQQKAVMPSSHLCDVCGKTYSQRYGLMKHINLEHHCLREFWCGHCVPEKSFTSKNGLISHIERKHVRADLPCSVCERVFRTHLTLRHHLKVHEGTDAVARKKDPVKCMICNKTFRLRHQLVKHVRSHTGETPYKCSHCPREFSRYTNMTMHERLHTGDKRYKCDRCGKCFTHNVSKKNHVKKYHKEETEVRESCVE